MRSRLAWSVSVGLIAAIGLMAGLLAGRFVFARTPRLVIESDTIQAGTISLGSFKELSVPIANRGRSALRIFNVRVDCGCLRARVANREIPPGETSRLGLTITGTRVQKTGEQRVLLQSNDPNDPVRTIRVKFSVRPQRVVFTPSPVDFGRVAQSSLPVSLMVYMDYPAPNSDGIDISDPQEDFLECTKVTDSEILVRLLASAPSGEFVCPLYGLSSGDRYELLVTGYIRGAVYARPPYMGMTTSEVNHTGFARRLRFVPRGDNTISSIEKVTVSRSLRPWIRATYKAVSDDLSISIRRVSDVPGTAQFGTRVRGFVRVLLVVNNDSLEAVNIPVDIFAG